MVYPHEKWKVGFLAGFSFGDYHRESFFGNYMFEEIEQKLRVDMITRYYSFRAGVKVINHISNKRVKPFTEIYISRTSIKTWFTIDEQRRNEQTPVIDHGDIERDYTLVYHINAGLEFNLMKKKPLHNERYNGKGFFFSIGFGYAYGAQPVNHVDISQRVSSFEETLNSDLNYARIISSETSFSTYVPRFESNIRLLNLSFAFVYRL